MLTLFRGWFTAKDAARLEKIARKDIQRQAATEIRHAMEEAKSDPAQIALFNKALDKIKGAASDGRWEAYLPDVPRGVRLLLEDRGFREKQNGAWTWKPKEKMTWL